MKRRPLTALALLAAMPAPVDHPQTYLASIVALPMRADERISAFAIETWGVEFLAVCRLPPGWRITAGSSASPNGDLKGQASQGITWLYGPSPTELAGLVLVRMVAPVQRRDARSGTGVVPATFKGIATVETPDASRRVRLSYSNMRLRPARACPLRAR